MKFEILYKETYAKNYSVEADDYETAVSKLDKCIREGAIDGPTECIESEYIMLENIQA